MLQNGESVSQDSKGSYHGSWELLHHLRRVGKEKKIQIRVVSGKKKKSGTRGAAECVTDVLTTF